MKNAPFYLLIGILAIIFGTLALVIFLQASGGELPENALYSVCAIGFLVAAFIFWELTMKPGLYIRRKEEEKEGEPKSPQP